MLNVSSANTIYSSTLYCTHFHTQYSLVPRSDGLINVAKENPCSEEPSTIYLPHSKESKPSIAPWPPPVAQYRPQLDVACFSTHDLNLDLVRIIFSVFSWYTSGQSVPNYYFTISLVVVSLVVAISCGCHKRQAIYLYFVSFCQRHST